ncbi:SDR family NAD(P)-dependent oxidoreductase [Fontibacter flavus]|uniref:SDR family NAD(P)-dependent oxidoreductase n=1 Tax=Fontibacter flavus TaxID=654838 RepID=A0ABV6FMP7_9BACT|nr:SDR family NAD(P)-dependent oxidoreductase [Cyclobacteriaceae bacterium]
MKIAITGPTSGIGEITFKKLASSAEQLFLLARNKEKATQLISELPKAHQEKVIFVPLDLADLDSVIKASELIKSQSDFLDILINNAGGIFNKKHITKDGFELSLSANHLGHFLLTHHLMDLLLKSKSPKVINLSSEAHRAAKVNFEDLNYEKSNYASFNAYANVKLFNILFTKSLKEKYGEKGLQSFALHPGVVKTNFGQESGGIFKLFWKLATPFMITPEEGAKTTLYLAQTTLPNSFNGYYFKNSKPLTPSSTARSKEMRDQLWSLSEEKLAKWL